MRVAYITHYTDLYGANRSLLGLLRTLRAAGDVEPLVITPGLGDLTKLLANEGFAFEVAHFQPWMTKRHYSGGPHHRLEQFIRHTLAAARRARTNRMILPELIARVKRFDPHVVHSNSAAVSIGVDLAQALGRPLVWHIREMPERQYDLHLDKGRRGFGAALRKARHLIMVSQAVAEDVRRYAGDLPAQSIIHNGVMPQDEFGKLLAQRNAEGTDRPFTFVLVGVMHPAKGQVEAVEALAIVLRSAPKVRLVLVGGGNDVPVRQRVKVLGIDGSVEFKGFVEDPYPVLLQADACLMCSRNEGMGRVTIEAMACALPVIGHASGGTLELIRPGVTGLLYEAGSNELAKRMMELMSDALRAGEMGQAGARYAAANFTNERYAAQVLSVYRSIMDTGL